MLLCHVGVKLLGKIFSYSGMMDYYWFVCVSIRFDECVEGGESIVVDLLAVTERLRVTHPHHFATLVRIPATFIRIHYER